MASEDIFVSLVVPHWDLKNPSLGDTYRVSGVFRVIEVTTRVGGTVSEARLSLEWDNIPTLEKKHDEVDRKELPKHEQRWVNIVPPPTSYVQWRKIGETEWHDYSSSFDVPWDDVYIEVRLLPRN